MKPLPGSILPLKVDVSYGLASPECRQPPGTTSHVYDWMGYDPEEDRMILLATVHMFRKPDGTIGGSGKPDPVFLVVNGEPWWIRNRLRRMDTVLT